MYRRCVELDTRLFYHIHTWYSTSTQFSSTLCTSRTLCTKCGTSISTTSTYSGVLCTGRCTNLLAYQVYVRVLVLVVLVPHSNEYSEYSVPGTGTRRCNAKCGTGTNVQTHDQMGAYISYCEDANVAPMVKNEHLRILVIQF
jgi:hypothetical protein